MRSSPLGADMVGKSRNMSADMLFMPGLLALMPPTICCVGQALAMAELKHVTAALASRFVFEAVEPPTPDFFLTLKPSGARLRARRWSAE